MSLLDTIRQKNPSLRDRSDDELKTILRKSPEFTTFTDDQFERFVSGPASADPAPTKKETPGFTGGLAAGVDQVQAMGGGLLQAAGDLAESDALWEAGRDIYQDNMAEAEENALGYGFTDIQGAGDAWNWARFTAGNLLPTLATSVAGGGVGGIAARALAGQAAKQAAGKAGQALGAMAASTGMETGAIMGETQDLDVSLAHGALAGSLDALLPFQLLRKAGADDVADQAASEISDNVLRDLRARAAQSGTEAASRGSLTGLLTEAPTEGLQGLISQHANYWVENNGESLLNHLDEVDVKSIVDEAAAGGLMGGALGAPTGLIERGQANAQLSRIEQARDQAAAAGGDALDQVMAAQGAESEVLSEQPIPEPSQGELAGDVNVPLDVPPLQEPAPLPEGLRESDRPQPTTDNGTATSDGPTGFAADDLSPFQRNQLRDYGVTDEQLWDMPTNQALAELDAANRSRQVQTGDLSEQGTGVYRVPTDQIQVDPEQYQFRSRVNQDGVDERLSGVTKWDDNRAGTLLLHRRRDGSIFAADGHHRRDLALRLGQPDVNARILEEADGFDVPAARVEAAMANIADGKAEPLDVAKVFRDVDAPNKEIREQFDLPRNQVSLDGEALANLSDNAFGLVSSGQLSEKDGAAIGASFDDPAQQEAAVRAFQNGEPKTAFERQLLVNEIKAAGFAESQGDQGGLFGDDPTEISLLQQRLSVLNSLRQALTFDKKLFGSLNKNADRAGEAGNKIATEANKEITQESANALEMINRVSTTPALNEMVNRAARRLVDGEKKAPVVRDLKAELRAYEQGNYQPPVNGESSEGSAAAPGQQPTEGEGLEPGSDQPVSEGDFPGSGEGGQPQGELTPDLELESQSEADLAVQELERQEAERAEAEARRKEEERIRADEQLDDFTLSGSDRPVDVAESRGQGNMFDVMGQPAEAEPEPQQSQSVADDPDQPILDDAANPKEGAFAAGIWSRQGQWPEEQSVVHTDGGKTFRVLSGTFETLDSQPTIVGELGIVDREAKVWWIKDGTDQYRPAQAIETMIEYAREQGVAAIRIPKYLVADDESGTGLASSIQKKYLEAAGFESVRDESGVYSLVLDSQALPAEPSQEQKRLVRKFYDGDPNTQLTQAIQWEWTPTERPDWMLGNSSGKPFATLKGAVKAAKKDTERTNKPHAAVRVDKLPVDMTQPKPSTNEDLDNVKSVFSGEPQYMVVRLPASRDLEDAAISAFRREAEGQTVGLDPANVFYPATQEATPSAESAPEPASEPAPAPVAEPQESQGATYGERFNDRDRRIRNASSTAELDAIMAEEMRDDERDPQGTQILQVAAETRREQVGNQPAQPAPQPTPEPAPAAGPRREFKQTTDNVFESQQDEMVIAKNGNVWALYESGESWFLEEPPLGEFDSFEAAQDEAAKTPIEGAEVTPEPADTRTEAEIEADTQKRLAEISEENQSAFVAQLEGMSDGDLESLFDEVATEKGREQGNQVPRKKARTESGELTAEEKARQREQRQRNQRIKRRGTPVLLRTNGQQWKSRQGAQQQLRNWNLENTHFAGKSGKHFELRMLPDLPEGARFQTESIPGLTNYVYIKSSEADLHDIASWTDGDVTQYNPDKGAGDGDVFLKGETVVRAPGTQESVRARLNAGTLRGQARLEALGDEYPDQLPKENPRSAGAIAKSLGINATSSFTNAIDGLTELFGGGRNLNSGFSFDEQTYQKAKPYFVQAARNVADAGKDLKELFRVLLDAFGADLKPYILRFARDLRDGTIDLSNAEDSNDVPGSNADLESDSRDAEPGDKLGTDPVFDEAGADGEGAGAPGGQAEPGRPSGQGGAGVSGGGAASGGKRSDQPVHSSDGEFGAPQGAAGSDDARGSGQADDDGVRSEPRAGQTADDVASEARQQELDKEARKRAQAATETADLAIEPGSEANIAEHLPMLLPDQQGDVAFFERRLLNNQGHGVLTTNGTGTGKTFSGLGLIKRYERMGRDNIMIVVPNNKIASDWKGSGQALALDVKQLRDTQDNGGRGIVVTTYANFRDNLTLLERDWDLLVFDESHYLRQKDDFSTTKAEDMRNALTGHPRGRYAYHKMKHPEEYARIEELQESRSPYGDNPRVEAELEEIFAKLRPLQEEDDANRAELWERNGTDTLMLSATPFPYRFSVDSAEGYLFDYPKEGERIGYHTRDGRDMFFIQNFGYRIRYNKLTQPEAGVDNNLMERSFAKKLQDEGVMRSRMLEVDQDYDRRFYEVESQAGLKIDEGLTWLDQRAEETQNEDLQRGLRDLGQMIRKRFDYLSRAYFLEAVKAKEMVPTIREHLRLGRKVVVFHDFNKGGGFNPFQVTKLENRAATGEDKWLVEAYKLFKSERSDLQQMPLNDLVSPRERLAREFKEALFFNGQVPKKQRIKNADLFNDDDSGHDLIVVQSDAGREGVSMHDTSGKHQRALINLGLPSKPIASIQTEGRIYRTFVRSNAIQRYVSTGLSLERWAIASKLAERSGTAENLAMGEQARGLKDAILEAYEMAGEYPPGHEGEGIGGKARDRALVEAISDFDRAKTYYFGTAKNSKRRDQREGKDYYATPEPLGQKMVEWADVAPNEKILEPSAGHGAILRWMPEDRNVHFVEPSSDLASKAALNAPHAEYHGGGFEDLNIVNKFDAVVMNPPYGQGGSTAWSHVAKAAKHLANGGRIVALMPQGPAADRAQERYLESDEAKQIYTVGEIVMPAVTFERAGTGVRTKIVILERHTDSDNAPQPFNRSLDYVEEINELFDEIEGMAVPDRTRVEPAAEPAPATPAASQGQTPQEGPTYATSDEFVTHVTKRGKELTGVIARDLTKEQAKEIDPYTFKKDGGFFIRARHVEATSADSQEAPAFMRRSGATTSGLSEAQVQATVDAFLKAYPGADNVGVEIHRSAASLPGYNAERDGDGAATISGQYVSRSDTLHLVAGAFSSRRKVQEALQEEILVHKGLGFFAPADREQLYRDIQTAAGESREVKALWDQTVEDYQPVVESAGLNQEQANRLYAEELLGALAQERPNWMKRGWRKLWRGIKRLLVKAGWIQPSIGTAELRDRIQLIGEAFQRGQRAPRRDFAADVRGETSQGGDVPAFSRILRDLTDTRLAANGEASRLKNPVRLKDGGRLSGFTTEKQDIFYGFDENGERFTLRADRVRPEQIVSSRDDNRTAEAIREGLRAQNDVPAFSMTREEWRKANRVTQRQKRVPAVQAAAQELAAGRLSQSDYIEAVRRNQPIQPLDQVPELPTLQEVAYALDESKAASGIVGLDKQIEPGTRVGLRLDIPAYDFYDTFVVSIHDGQRKSGKVLGYSQTGAITNVEFMTAPKGALRIATGDSAKAPIARMHGDWFEHDAERLAQGAEKLLNAPGWTQVGLNMFRHSWFYDKADGMPLASAERVIQVGPLVLAKGVKKISPQDDRFRIAKDSDIRFSLSDNDNSDALPLPEVDVEEVTNDEEIARILEQYEAARSDQSGSGARGQERGAAVGGRPSAPGWQSQTAIRGRGDQPAVIFRGSQTGLTPADFQEERFGFSTGHPSSGLGVFFTSNRADASGYGNPEAFYLDMRNPLVLNQEDLPSFNSSADATRYRNAIRAQGYDGIVVDYSDVGGPRHYIPFEPEQAIPAQEKGNARYRLNGQAKAKVLGASIRKAIQAVPELAEANIVETTDQLPEKAQVEAALQGIDPSRIRGLYVDGELYVVASNIETVQEGIEVALHEAVGHKGIRGVLGKDLDSVMLRLYRSLPNSPEGREALAEIKRNYPFLDPKNRDDRIAIAEEMVAHLLEKGYRPKAWQRAVAKIRDLLRKLIPSVAWTYTDVLALGEQAREHLRRRKAGTGEAALRYSLASRERISGGNLFDDFNATDLTAAAKIGPRSAPRRVMDAWKEATQNAGLKIRQGMVDRLAAFKEMDERLLGEGMLQEDITRSSWVLGRMANAANGALHAMLHNGRIELDREQKVLGLKDDDSKGLGAVFAKLASHNDPDSGSAEVQRFMGWIAGNRARKLLDQGRENLFSEEEIGAMEAWDRGTLPDGRNRAEVYQEVFAEFQAYRDDVLAVADQAGLLRKAMDPDDATLFMAKKHGIRADLVKRANKARKAANRADDLEVKEQAEARESEALGELQDALVTELGMAEFDQEYDMLTTDQRELWANEFYVPFYRINEDEKQPTGQLSTNGLSRQQAYKRLKGGTQNLNDLLENTMMNFHHLLDASLKNQAAQQAVTNAQQLGMARRVPASNRNPKTSTFILEEGEKVYYQVDDPLVFQALTALSNAGMNNMAMKIMRGFKRLFTNMTTTTPQFMVANLIRDSLQATATNEVSKNAFANVIGGARSYKDQKTRAQMMASGASFNFGHLYGNNPDELRAQLTRDMRGAKLISKDNMGQALVKGWDWWNNVNNATENLNRAAIFTQNQERGKLKAAFESRDLIDFSAHGAWPAVRILIDIVPFLNARIQGLDKIYRSGIKPGASVLKSIFGGDDPKVSDKQAAGRFWSVTGALALATIALYLHNEDDEEYQKLEEWQKDTYWFVRFGDQAFFIPKPFEVGAIATMAERITEQFVNDKATGKVFRERMYHMVTDTFAFSPVPQAVQPVLDVYANYDAFTQRPIESMGMERLSPELRKRASTSKAAEWISNGLNATVGALGDPDTNPLALSPVQVDHLIGGYLGQVGTWAASSGDVAWRVATGKEAPARRWYEYQPVRRFYSNLGDEDRYTRYGTVFYEGLREAGRAYSDVKELREMGRLADAAELAESRQELLALRTPLNRAQRRLREINRKIDVVRRANLDGEVKRQQIDRLRAIKNQIQRALGERVEQARAR